VPASERLPEFSQIFQQEKVLKIVAPPFFGKTTWLHEIVDGFNSGGDYYATYISLAPLNGIVKTREAVLTLIGLLQEDLKSLLESQPQLQHQELFNVSHGSLGRDHYSTRGNPNFAIMSYLARVSEAMDKPWILFFDDTDALIGPPLFNIINQFQAGLNKCSQTNKRTFPMTLGLVGTRKKITQLESFTNLGNPQSVIRTFLLNPRNLNAIILHLHSLTTLQINSLFESFNQDYPNRFSPEAIERIIYWANGHPYLVNRLAWQLLRQMKPVFSNQDVDDAALTIAESDSPYVIFIKDRLKEQRVIWVMDPIYSGTMSKIPRFGEDTQYAKEMGLINLDNDFRLLPASPLVNEVIVRELTNDLAGTLLTPLERSWTEGDTLFLTDLLITYQGLWLERKDYFFSRHAEFLVFQHVESVYAFITYAFLKKTLKKNAWVELDICEGRGFTNILISHGTKKYLVSVKIKEDPNISDSINQLAKHWVETNVHEVWLTVFDSDKNKSLKDKVYYRTEKLLDDLFVHILGF
jgi:hypothetical protein